jgi:hypothetical protein
MDMGDLPGEMNQPAEEPNEMTRFTFEGKIEKGWNSKWTGVRKDL